MKRGDWDFARRAWLASNPFCALCLKKSKPLYERATVVDHIKPHRGDRELFWDSSNWQSLCVECHNRKTATEDGGFGR